jgi:hypothetical protein
MRRLRLLPVLAVIVVLPAVAGARTPASGIAGRTVEGPTCPVQRNPPDPRCAPRPIAVSVSIRRDAKHAKARIVQSGSDGRFRVHLAPGTYIVQGLQKGKSPFPRPPGPQTVQVSGGHFTRVTLTYDTGIR